MLGRRSDVHDGCRRTHSGAIGLAEAIESGGEVRLVLRALADMRGSQIGYPRANADQPLLLEDVVVA